MEVYKNKIKDKKNTDVDRPQTGTLVGRQTKKGEKNRCKPYKKREPVEEEGFDTARKRHIKEKPWQSNKETERINKIRKKKSGGTNFHEDKKGEHQDELNSEPWSCHHVPFSSQNNLFDVYRVIW